MRRTKILAAMLSLVFVFMLFPSLRVNAAASGTCGDNVTWTLEDNGTLTISGSGEMADYTNEFNPKTATEYLTTPWYMYNSFIKAIVIENGVTSIGRLAFAECPNITSITIPNSVASIGRSAFSGCSGLTSIEIPNSVSIINAATFCDCSNLSEIIIPNSVTVIEYNAFVNCNNLSSITIPNSITSIGSCAFGNCSGLTSITIPDSVTSLGYKAFDNCDNLKTVTMSWSEYNKLGADSINKCFDGNTVTIYFCKETLTADNGTISVESRDYTNGTITLKLEPDTNGILDSVSVKYSDGTEEDVIPNNGKYIVDVTKGDIEVKATFIPTYEIKFVNTDGTVLQNSTVVEGDTPICTITPTKATDEQYTYTFSGWTPTIAPATTDTTYTATYSTTTNEYTVTFTDADGNQLQSGKLPYGSVPAYSDTPAKAETDKYTYTFAGWKSGNLTYGASSTLPQVSADVTYTAVFTETAKSTTPAPGTYYVQSIEEKDGAIVITIKRTENDDQTYELVQNIETDGKQLNVGDQIELTSGSAIITIKKDYVSTLTPGTHTMKVTFKDGGSITLEYTVKEPEKAAAQAVQATGEATAITAIVGVGMILAACGVAIFAKKRREEA